MVCYGMVWYGLVWCGVMTCCSGVIVWYGVVWCNGYSGMLPTRTTPLIHHHTIITPSSSPSHHHHHHYHHTTHHHTSLTITPSSLPSHHSPSSPSSQHHHHHHRTIITNITTITPLTITPHSPSHTHTHTHTHPTMRLAPKLQSTNQTSPKHFYLFLAELFFFCFSTPSLKHHIWFFTMIIVSCHSVCVSVAFMDHCNTSHLIFRFANKRICAG